MQYAQIILSHFVCDYLFSGHIANIYGRDSVASPL